MCTPATAGVRRASGNDGDGWATLVVRPRLSAARAELMIFWERARSSRRPLPIHLTSGNNPASYGAVPEWLWSGLQICPQPCGLIRSGRVKTLIVLAFSAAKSHVFARTRTERNWTARRFG